MSGVWLVLSVGIETSIFTPRQGVSHRDRHPTCFTPRTTKHRRPSVACSTGLVRRRGCVADSPCSELRSCVTSQGAHMRGMRSWIIMQAYGYGANKAWRRAALGSSAARSALCTPHPVLPSARHRRRALLLSPPTRPTPCLQALRLVHRTAPSPAHAPQSRERRQPPEAPKSQLRSKASQRHRGTRTQHQTRRRSDVGGCWQQLGGHRPLRLL